MRLSLTKNIIGAKFIEDGLLTSDNGVLYQAFSARPISKGLLEEDFNGANSEHFFNKMSELLTRLPSFFEGQIVLFRKKVKSSISGFETRLFFFERVKKAESYSHLKALLSEIKLSPEPLTVSDWNYVLSGFIGEDILKGKVPDVIWEKDHLKVGSNIVKALSLTELPQLTWKGCFQPLFEHTEELILSLKINIPDRMKIKKQLETKRRVSHALSISSSLEVRNIESNSVLHSSEETLERILVSKETLFEISMAIILHHPKDKAESISYDLERVTSGIGNAGLFKEGVGTMSVFKSHIPTNSVLNIRKLPILSSNLSELFPVLLDYSVANEKSSLELRSRSLERSYLNLFSKDNLNYNAFICGASGSGKSFLMNAILLSQLRDEPNSRLCIFDVGGSYRRIITKYGGQSITLSLGEANSLIATYLRNNKVNKNGFFKTFIELLCGGGKHITHSHQVAIDDLLSEFENEHLTIKKLIALANSKTEKCYHDIALWLKPHLVFDAIHDRSDLQTLITSKISAFDFKELDSSPLIQRVTIFLLCELLWKDLTEGTYPKTLVVFDEVWRFFALSKNFLEEMYRTLRKYKAGIVSITQNLADYGDDAFSKMIFTNSFTKIFLQNGASKDYLKNTFDLSESDIKRALSVSSHKPKYSEFFVLSSEMSQVFRLYPDPSFYELAQTENISEKNNN